MIWINANDRLPELDNGLVIKGDELTPDKTKKLVVLTDRGNITDNYRVKKMVEKKEWTWLMGYEDGDTITHWAVFEPPTASQIPSHEHLRMLNRRLDAEYAKIARKSDADTLVCIHSALGGEWHRVHVVGIGKTYLRVRNKHGEFLTEFDKLNLESKVNLIWYMKEKLGLPQIDVNNPEMDMAKQGELMRACRVANDYNFLVFR